MALSASGDPAEQLVKNFRTRASGFPQVLTKHRLGTNLVGFNNAPGKGCRRLSFFLPFRHHGEDLVENLDIEQAQEDPGQNLKAIVSEIAGGGLQKQSFLRLSHEA